MIEIRERKGKPGEYDLALDGKVIDRGNQAPPSYEIIEVDLDDTQGGFEFELSINDNILNLIAKCHFSELPTDVSLITKREVVLFNPTPKLFEISRQDNADRYKLQFNWLLSLRDWKEAFSFEQYFQECQELAKSTASPQIALEDINDFFPNMLRIFAHLESPQLTIGEEIERCESAIDQLFKEVKDSLRSKLNENSVLTYFDFPEEVKVPCEQYLLYFVQFLRDLGVGVTAEVQHEVGQVLFAVTPTDKEVALDKIRVALEIYMRLPSSPVSDLSANDDIAIQRLEANIYHLKSQLKLAHAEVLTNERTIQAQQTIINSQQRLVDGLVILESAKAVTPSREREDKEDLLPGVLAVTKYKGKGFELGLPEILRWLKEFLHRK